MKNWWKQKEKKWSYIVDLCETQPFWSVRYKRLRFACFCSCWSANNVQIISFCCDLCWGLILSLFFVVLDAESVTSVNATLAAGAKETILTPSIHDLQIYGVVVTILLCFIVFGGVKIINRVAPAFLVPVLFSVFCIFIGIFAAPKHNASCKFCDEYYLVLVSMPFFFYANKLVC